jgi:hypothetical protein
MISEFLQEILDGKLKVVDPATVDSRVIVPSAMTNMCLNELKKDVKNFIELKPISGSYVVDNGLRLNRYLNPDVCYQPWGIYEDEECIASVDYGKSYIYYFEMDASLRKSYKTNENADNRSPISADFDDTNIFCGTYYNRLISINKDTKEVEWEFGTYNSRGKCSDGKIGKPYKIKTATSGNLLVLTSDGAGDADRYYGTLEEFDKDGNWIKTLLQDSGTGLGSNLETHYPRSLYVDGDTVYVGKSDDIDVFTYDVDDGLAYVKTIRKPASSGVSDLDLTDFLIDGDTLYVLSANMEKVIGFNIVTGVIEFSVGHFHYENSSLAEHEGNAMNSPRGLLLTSEGKLFVSDASNCNICEVFRSDYIHPRYEVPENIEIIYSSQELNGDNTTNSKIGKEPENLRIVYKDIL